MLPPSCPIILVATHIVRCRASSDDERQKHRVKNVAQKFKIGWLACSAFSAASSKKRSKLPRFSTHLDKGASAMPAAMSEIVLQVQNQWLDSADESGLGYKVVAALFLFDFICVRRRMCDEMEHAGALLSFVRRNEGRCMEHCEVLRNE